MNMLVLIAWLIHTLNITNDFENTNGPKIILHNFIVSFYVLFLQSGWSLTKRARGELVDIRR